MDADDLKFSFITDEGIVDCAQRCDDVMANDRGAQSCPLTKPNVTNAGRVINDIHNYVITLNIVFGIISNIKHTFYQHDDDTGWW